MKTNKSFTLFCVASMLLAISCQKAEIKPTSILEGKKLNTLDSEKDKLLLHAGTTRGSLDGKALEAKFDDPKYLSLGPDNFLYVYDNAYHFEDSFNEGNRKIRKITTSGIVTTIFDLAERRIEGIFSGMAIDKKGNIYVSHHNQIKKISPDGKSITVIAGTGEGYDVPMKDGLATEATFFDPAGLVFSKTGCLYIMDRGNNAVRRLVNGKVTTIAGGIRYYVGPFDEPDRAPKDGIGPKAEFDNPEFITIDDQANIYVTGGKFPLIRKVTPKGVVTNIGNKPYYDSDYYETFTGITFAENGNLYVNRNSANGKRAPFFFSISKLTVAGTLTPIIERIYSMEYPETNIPGLYFPTGLVTVGDTGYVAVTSDYQIRKFKLE